MLFKRLTLLLTAYQNGNMKKRPYRLLPADESGPEGLEPTRSVAEAQLICEIDREGTLLQTEPLLSELLGFTKLEMLGHKLDEFVVPSVGSQTKAWLAKLLETGATQLQLTTKDDRRISATINASEKLDDSGIKRSAELKLLNLSGDRPTQTEYNRVQIALKQRERELTALNAAGRAITASLNLQHVLAMVAEQIQTLLAAELTFVLMRDPAEGNFVIVAAAGTRSSQLEGTRLSAESGLAGWVARERAAVIVDDAQNDPRFDASVDKLTGMITGSLIAVPLKFKGALWGVAQAVDPTAGQFDWHHQEILESLSNWATIAIENAHLYQSGREQYRRLQDSQARLIHSEKMAALGRLAASLAHEINNPLQSIGMCLSLIKESIDEREDSGDLRLDLGMAMSEVQRLSILMQQLRDYYRPERKAQQLTDVAALERNVLHLTAYQLNNGNINVELNCDQDLPRVVLNPDQLYQVFLNLILNAIDAMPDGGTLKIDTTWQKESDNHPPLIQIMFCDSGEGIAPEDLPRIFEPFFTTKKTGTGLGLSTSYEIINSFGGNISVSSSPGAGTTFTVNLPVRDE